MNVLMQLAAIIVTFFSLVVQAEDPTCDFPLLDNKVTATAESCKKLNEEPYQKKFLAYTCSDSCTDLNQCLDNFSKLRKDSKITDAISKVESTTAKYPIERRKEKCGQFEPNPPVDTKDDALWENFRQFVEARRQMNKLLKDDIKTVKNQCIRRDKMSGAYMRLIRTERYSDLLNQCKTLAP